MSVISTIDFFINNPKYVWAIISFVAFVIVMIAIINIHLSKDYKKFNLINLMAIDSITGNPSDSKFRLNIAFVITTWAFVYLTMDDKLTEWYVVAFLTAWVTDRIFSRNSQLDQHRMNLTLNTQSKEDDEYGNYS